MEDSGRCVMRIGPFSSVARIAIVVIAMHPHTLTLLVAVTLVLAVLVGLALGFVGLRLL
jgi:hypothetical protein